MDSAPAPASSETVDLTGTAAVDVGRPLTPSPRSSSPASDNIDEDLPAVTFASPKTTRVTRSGASGSSTSAARGSRQPNAQDGRDPAGPGAANKRGKAQHARANSNRDAQDFARRGEGAYEGEIIAGHGHPGMNPLDRLLDIDYARDFGDPVARFDAMRNQPPQSMNLTTSAAPSAHPIVPTPPPDVASQPPSAAVPPQASEEPAAAAVAELVQVSEGTMPSSEVQEAEVKMDTTS